MFFQPGANARLWNFREHSRIPANFRQLATGQHAEQRFFVEIVRRHVRISIALAMQMMELACSRA